jgi:Fe-S oxidoreductase
MLFEMLQGDVVTGGWKDKDVKASLDLCLACKGCKGDCPVNVDIATLKSEFLSHYYKGRLRPRHAYAFGWIYWWARLASHAPRLVNFLTHAPLFRGVARWLAGVAPEREIPRFAPRTFRKAFREKSPAGEQRPKVILWADTFNNFFLPETLSAAVEVLEAAGYRVVIPRRILCCGRPLYDFGMLSTAKKMLLQVLEVLREDIRAGVPVVGLEPSCVAVFRDELCDLLPDDQDAKRLKQQTYTLSEFLEKKAPGFRPPRWHVKAIVHGHCHQRAIMKMDSEKKLLKAMGLDAEILDSGCCGMAGVFGYERSGGHYQVSVKAGERVLLPAVRTAAASTLVIADGFSCREQISQLTDRKALHLAEVIRMALEQGHAGAEAPAVEKSTETVAPQGPESPVADHALGTNVLYEPSPRKPGG